MSYKIPNILALDVGARLIGAAIFEDQKLAFYAIKSIKRPTKAETLKQVRNVLERLIFDYGIQVITLETLNYPQQRGSFAHTIYKEVKIFGKKRNIKLVEFEPLFVRQTICKDKIPTKQKTFGTITRLYPELSKFLMVTRIWQKMYYAYLFNAIAVGLPCIKAIKVSKNNQVKMSDESP